MRIEDSYARLEPVLKAVNERVKDIIHAYASQAGYLVAGRIKSLDSLAAKLQTGRYQSLSELDDLIAYSLIIDTRAQEGAAISYFKKVFKIVRQKGKTTLQDERVFDFDATRLYAKLRLHDERGPLASVTFEIQIRTLLQHAWSKITHPIVYKSSFVDARQLRLAAEILAQLECADRSFARFKTAASGVKRVRRPRTVSLNYIVTEVDRLVSGGVIPSELRPSDARRFAESILGLYKDDRNIEQDTKCISDFLASQAEAFPRSVSIYELAIVALLRAHRLRTGGNKAPYLYITQDLQSLFPEVRALQRVVSLDWHPENAVPLQSATLPVPPAP